MKHSTSGHTAADSAKHDHSVQDMHKGSYKKLSWMMLLSFIAMYCLMYAMVDKPANVLPNINQFYMAGLMSSPMLVIELLLMGRMYPDKKLNRILIGAGIIALAFFYSGIRTQAAVGDRQFLKSMVPHHAGAILMVQQADLSDPEVKELARQIIASQQKEIGFMKAKIRSLP